MIPAKRNQLSIVGNKYQTEAKRVLVVCSAGLLRSPTGANVLHQSFGYNTRAAGSSEEYALIPVSEALIEWAEEIVFVNSGNFNECLFFNERLDWVIRDKAIVLSIEDDYEWGDNELKDMFLTQYNQLRENNNESY